MSPENHGFNWSPENSLETADLKFARCAYVVKVIVFSW